MKPFDPIESLAEMRHEFGEHGGVNMSIETSTTFTVMDAETMPEIFPGRRGPETAAATSTAVTSTRRSTCSASSSRRSRAPRPATARPAA